MTKATTSGATKFIKSTLPGHHCLLSDVLDHRFDRNADRMERNRDRIAGHLDHKLGEMNFRAYAEMENQRKQMKIQKLSIHKAKGKKQGEGAFVSSLHATVQPGSLSSTWVDPW